jgi:hypothetical protein
MRKPVAYSGVVKARLDMHLFARPHVRRDKRGPRRPTTMAKQRGWVEKKENKTNSSEPTPYFYHRKAMPRPNPSFSLETQTKSTGQP